MSTTIEIRRAYRLVLDPTCEQTESLKRHAGACRKAFNWALDAKMAAHRAYSQELAWLTYTTFAELAPDAALAAAKTALRGDQRFKIPGYVTMSARYTAERGDDAAGIDGWAPWWRSVDRRAFITGFQNADAAWKNWLDSHTGQRRGQRVGYPRFKKRGRCTDSFALAHDVTKPGIRLEDARHLRLPKKIGVVRLHSSARRLVTKLRRGSVTITSVRITRRGHRWIAALAVVEQIPVPHCSRRQRDAGAVGVDLGIKSLAALSTGELVPNPRHQARDAERIAKLQRSISRCQKGSRNRERLVQRLGTARARQAERRNQTLHQLTKRLAANFASVVIEDLNVAGMTRSAAGTVEAPGRNVRAKSGLNREILDVAFGEVRRQLAYKTLWYGSTLKVVDRFLPSSKQCSRCGSIRRDLRLSDRTYRCPACGLVLDRDLNAARNLLAAHDSPTEFPARPTPGSAGSNTPDTCDERDPEAKIGTPGETKPPTKAVPSLTREDPPTGGPPSPSNLRELPPRRGPTRQARKLGHHP